MLPYYPEMNPGQFSALLMMGYAHLALHDAQAAAEALETARQVALGGSLFFGIVEATFHLARLMQSQGELRRAEQICRQGQADIAALLPQSGQELPASGCLDIALGSVLIEQNRLEEAEQHLRRGLELIGWGANPFYLMTAYTALFRLYEFQDRQAEALACLERLETLWPDVDFLTQGLRVLHGMRSAPQDAGALADAADWRRAFQSSPGDDMPMPGMGPIGAAEVYYQAFLLWVRVQIEMGEGQAVRPYLDRQLAQAAAHGLNQRVIELSLLSAQAALAEGDEQRAFAALERALALAQPEGSVRVFDQGPALTHLLSAAAERGLFRTYIERVLAALGGGSEGAAVISRAAPGDVSGLIEALSERELEVLGLMAQGASNQAIAKQLVITVGTVKSHVNHILRKLDAHNRTEAVARARQAGLLDL